METNLNDDITRRGRRDRHAAEEPTAQLNLANQIMQGIPSQLDGINMLYSAITGYNQKNG